MVIHSCSRLGRHFFVDLIRNYWNFPNPCEAVIFETVLDVLIKLVLFITRLDVVVWEKKILSAYFRNNSDLLPTLPPVRKLTARHSPSKYTFKYIWNLSLSSTVLFSSRPPTSNLQIHTRVYLWIGVYNHHVRSCMSISYDPSFEIGLEFSGLRLVMCCTSHSFQNIIKDTLSEYANVDPKCYRRSLKSKQQRFLLQVKCTSII